MPGPGAIWSLVAAGLFLVGWLAMLVARLANDRDRPYLTRILIVVAALLTVAGCGAGLMGPYVHGMDPTVHVYPAVVWILVIWTVAHGAVALVMQLYCLARSFAGRLTGAYDQDIQNVVLYWHFMLFTALVTFATIGLFPSMR